MRDTVITRPQTIVELIALAPPLTAALTAQRQCSRVWPSLTFLACFVYLPQLPADHRHCNGDNQDTARNSERINRNTKQLQDAIAEE